MTGRPTLFLSSTVMDLGPFRDAAVHVCQRLGIDVTTMEEFGPDPRAAVAVCREKVERAELFLGLYAHRYGFVPDGFGGRSITQLEYEWAVARGLPVLLFVVDDERPWPPKWVDRGPEWQRLEAFKERFRRAHVVSPLTTPERLREDLFVHLPKFRDQPTVRTTAARPLPARPPQPYVAHQYTLLQTAQVVGRSAELARLDRWVADPAAARLLCIVAIGGMGKSALTWKWFHEHAPHAMAPLAGRMWWSFYESDAGFDRFVAAALAYCGGRTPESVLTLSPLDRERELLELLDRQPFLLVLDGLERVLIAYSNLDFAHLPDDDLDRRTANVVVGSRGLPQQASGTFIGRHRLRKTIDPRAGEFLRKLTRVRSARVLVTTRLYPSELQTVTGHELPGCAAWFLHGMDPDDALALWRAMDVSGTAAELRTLFATIDRYPLLIRALAGEVARYRPAPGDFDAWRAAHRNFDPFALPLVQAKSHVLEYALGALGDDARELLHTIAAFRSPVDYDTLSALFAQRAAWTPQRLDAVLTELEDRGLLGWDRRTNRYDLHPIVRGVVWSGLDDFGRRTIYGALEQHFSAIPAGSEGTNSLEEAIPLIELFNALVGLGQHEDARWLYFERIIDSGNFDFVALGVGHVNIAMLESLFPDGLDRPPATEQNFWVYAQLGIAYQDAGRLIEAHTCYRRALTNSSMVDTPDGDILARYAKNYEAISNGCIALNALQRGRLREALHHGQLAAATDDDSLIVYDFTAELVLCEATVGQSETALQRLATQTGVEHYDSRRCEARVRLWRGEHQRSAAFAAEMLLWARGSVRTKMEILLLLGEARMYLGQLDEAATLLVEVLREARAIAVVKPELDSLRCLADVHRRMGDHTQSRAFLDDLAEPAARGPYRLVQADAANVLAALERDCGNHDAAIAAAQNAYRLAWCDGPPHTYHWALERATHLLHELDAPAPPP